MALRWRGKARRALAALVALIALVAPLPAALAARAAAGRVAQRAGALARSFARAGRSSALVPRQQRCSHDHEGSCHHQASGKAAPCSWAGLPLVSQSTFFRLSEAIECRDELLRSSGLDSRQVGLFAEEVSIKGQRRFLVDTFEGFAQNLASRKPGSHFYEVILESSPCWLYFDLEFSKVANPGLDPVAVMSQFRRTLANFCADEGFAYDESLAVFQDSSTDVKFSSHVIVKCLAFENNHQAGLLVDMLLAYAERHRGAPGLLDTSLLFVCSPDSGSTTSVVDGMVYSRNRCFRVLNQAKFGKTATLNLADGGRVMSELDPVNVQVIRSLASFVPRGTPMCTHAKIPENSSHRPQGFGGDAVDDERFRPLVEWLQRTWDERRDQNEPRGYKLPARAGTLLFYPNCVVVPFAHNRYCCQRGRSHANNGIYFKVYPHLKYALQACHDKEDCGDVTFRFDLPTEVVAPLLEGGYWEDLRRLARRRLDN